jgi:2-dehydro-3-deoxy-D-gluconate 5-dehydrogenase
MKLFDLGGKAAIVTGGNGGIGRGIALGLAQAGADVCIAARDAAKSERVKREIEDLGRRCIAVRCDVDQTPDIEAAIDATRKAFGSVHILVNNAGRAVLKPPEAMTDEEWLSVIDTNLNSVFRFCRAVHPHFKSGGGGKIVNLGSMYSLFGSSFAPSYAASKGGVIQLTKSLAVAWAPDNIQVNAILPGWITTDMTAPVRGMTEMYQGIVSRTPAGRFGEPEECAGAAVFLASAASDFVTGQSLAVCGGYSIA